MNNEKDGCHAYWALSIRNNKSPYRAKKAALKVLKVFTPLRQLCGLGFYLI
jgi:hypothetical protein